MILRGPWRNGGRVQILSGLKRGEQVAAAGIGATQLTGRPVWDAFASAVIGVTLIGVALFLVLVAFGVVLLLGRLPPLF